MSLVISLLVFSFIILFHELGHFLAAKKNHVTVVEFSLGMGPRLLSTVKGGTRYSLKLLPFGGSCMMLGEDMADTGEGTFGGKSVWARIVIVAAGPAFNFLLAFLLSLFIIGSIGIDRPVILSVSDGFPAAQAGMRAGDEIISINGKRIFLYREISDYVFFRQEQMRSGQPLHVVWKSGGERREADLVPVDNGAGRYIFGISGNVNYREKAAPWQVALYSAYEVKYWVGYVLSGLRMMATGGVRIDDVSGPVGVVSVIGETYESAREDGAFYVWLNMLNIAILLSANLGVMNLLPIPALDGGRLLFFLIEALRGKRLNPEIEGRVHLAGFALLMALMMLILVNDVRKIFF